MKEIPLTQGKVTLVDDEDYEWLSKMKWHASFNEGIWYAVGSGRSSGNRNVAIHRFITNAPKGTVVDHINGNGLDNTRENLRVCTHAENIRNQRKQTRNKTGYKGVNYFPNTGKFHAGIKYNGVSIHIGYFDDPIDAAEAYDKKAKELFGKFARLNFPTS